MDDVAAQNMMDYTSAPAGLVVNGQLWTGSRVASTTVCGKCGRMGVVSDEKALRPLIVHTGLIVSGTLQGVDYCEFGFQAGSRSNRV
jgi:hypothetical protein